jgi:hypothetical protein
MQQKYYKPKQIANADCDNNIWIQYATLYQHAQYLQKNNT